MATRKLLDTCIRRAGIDPQARYRTRPADYVQRAQQVLGAGDTGPVDVSDRGATLYHEQEPTVCGLLRELWPSRQDCSDYFHHLFPAAGWLPRYNRYWLLGDAIAGLTVGLVVVPQAMAYALLARLTPEYGLYTSFTGAVCYWLFGTSRDIVIGTTAVGSLLIGSAVSNVQNARPGVYENAEVAGTLSFMVGLVLIAIGFLRLGWIVDFIPYISISAFVTAAAITIMSTQVPVLLGINGIDTHAAPYSVILELLKGLPRVDLNAAIGIPCLVLLFLLKAFFAKLEVLKPKQKQLWTMLNSLRFTFSILLFTLISFLLHRNNREIENRKFRIVGIIPVGFRAAGVPSLNSELMSLMITDLPAIMIILVIEHIAIAKSFGRIFSYTVIPSQEIIAQGIANLFSPFVGGYVCTGSFGASAVLSKAGVRTPLAGLFSALILILALYALTAVFFYIPNAALAALIVHATCNLLTPPASLYKYWQLSPCELVIWFVGLFLAIFESLEISIYVTIGLSLGLLLIRLARTKGSFMGRVRVYLATEQQIIAATSLQSLDTRILASAPQEIGLSALRDRYLPLENKDGHNPAVEVETPYPGVFVYQFKEPLTYINQAYQVDTIVSHIKSRTTPGADEDPNLKPHDRLWCDAGPRKMNSDLQAGDSENLPVLRAIVLDCSSINNLDVTSIQGLVDLRLVLDRHAGHYPVEWHFANLRNRWTRRALSVAGFGFPNATKQMEIANWSPAYAVVGSAAMDKLSSGDDRDHESDEEKGICTTPAERMKTSNNGSEAIEVIGVSGLPTQKAHGNKVALYGIDKPFFHGDVTDAVQVAIHNVKRQNATETLLK